MNDEHSPRGDGYKQIKLPVFFLDESGLLNRKDDQFFALGIVKTDRPHELQRIIRSIRDKAHFYEEIKWNKMSLLKFDICKAMIGAFVGNRSASFHSVILKKSELDFKKYFNSNLTRVYKSFTVMLVERCINSDNEIGTIVADDYFYPDGESLELQSRAILNNHYGKLVIASFLQINSQSSDLLQLTDLLLGMMLYDLKLQEGLVKQSDNLKSKTLKFLHEKLGVKESFFLNKKGSKQTSYLSPKFNTSIFRPSTTKDKNVIDLSAVK